MSHAWTDPAIHHPSSLRRGPYTDGVDLHLHLTDTLGTLGVRPEDRLGVATSGGADSTALLHLLASARGDLHVLHVDHGLREDSPADAEFVERLADDLGLRCTVLRPRVDVRRGDSIEAVARRARYEALDAAADRLGLTWVATGHTRDDQAETALLGVLRGRGAAGIAQVRGIFVRPLLDVSRADLRAWLTERGLAWREDPTNADVRFERNWVRHELMPALARRRPGVANAIARLAGRARADEQVLDALASEVFARASIDERGVLLPNDELAFVPRAIATRVVRKALWSLGADPSADVVSRIVPSDLRRRVRCGDVVVQRVPEGIAFVADAAPAPEPLVLDDGAVESASWGIRVRLGPLSQEPWRWRTALPAGRVAIRARVPGDRVQTAGGTRKVQDVLVDAKVPRPLRDLVPVVAVDDEPVAVVGLSSWPDEGTRVLDAEPFNPTWSRAVLWTRAST